MARESAHGTSLAACMPPALAQLVINLISALSLDRYHHACAVIVLSAPHRIATRNKSLPCSPDWNEEASVKASRSHFAFRNSVFVWTRCSEWLCVFPYCLTGDFALLLFLTGFKRRSIVACINNKS